MAHADHTITIARPLDEVFAYLADGANNPHWRTGVVQMHRTSATDGAGATYRQVLKGPGGRHIDGDYRVTGYRPPHLLEFAVTAGPARPSGRSSCTRPDRQAPGSPSASTWSPKVCCG